MEWLAKVFLSSKTKKSLNFINILQLERKICFVQASKAVSYLSSLPSSDSLTELYTFFEFILFLLIVNDTYNNRKLISISSMMIPFFAWGLSFINFRLLSLSSNHFWRVRARPKHVHSKVLHACFSFDQVFN